MKKYDKALEKLKANIDKYGLEEYSKMMNKEKTENQKTIFEKDSKAKVMGGDTLYIESCENMISSSITIHYYSKHYKFHKVIGLKNCNQNWDYLYGLDCAKNLNSGKFVDVLKNLWDEGEEIVIPLKDWYEKYRA